MATNKNSFDRPGAVKTIRVAGGVTLTQSVPGKVTRTARTAATATRKASY